MTIKKSNTKRFSDRVHDYIQYRPNYPESIINILEEELGFNRSFIVADIGSGTGISSIPFLTFGNKVFAVEPNHEMRIAAEEINRYNDLFISVNGKAEDTSLNESSVDLIFCGQAFHWFDRYKTKLEFKRILKDNGHIVLCWNQRNDQTPFIRDYDNMLKNQIRDYANVCHRNISNDIIADFFSPKKLIIRKLTHCQNFDFIGLRGRLMSSSYCPKQGKEYENLMSKLHQLFDKYQQNNLVQFDYETIIYCR